MPETRYIIDTDQLCHTAHRLAEYCAECNQLKQEVREIYSKACGIPPHYAQAARKAEGHLGGCMETLACLRVPWDFEKTDSGDYTSVTVGGVKLDVLPAVGVDERCGL